LSFPVVNGQYFYKIYLNELIDWYSYPVKEYVKDKRSAKEVVDSLIIDIRYPMYMGRPDDTHVLNMYHGKFKWCRKIDEDFWDKASMILGTNKVADCDGSAIVAVACLRAFGLKPEDVFVAFGSVRDAATNAILGGHAWTYARDPSFGTDKYVLCEMTLDTPPRYPEVGSTLEDLKKPFAWEGVVYEPEQLFNDVVYVEIKPLTTMRERRMRERKEKYEAIMKAWKIKTKYHAALERSKLYRIKRALRLAR
jgi:hypothetical protein